MARNGKEADAGGVREWLARAMSGPTHLRRPVYVLARLPVELLGTMPDHVLAAFGGLTLGMVVSARERLGIEPFDDYCHGRCACGRRFYGPPTKRWCSMLCRESAHYPRRRGGDVALHVALSALKRKIEDEKEG